MSCRRSRAMRTALAPLVLSLACVTMARAAERSLAEHRRVAALVRQAAEQGADEALESAVALLIAEDSPRVVDLLVELAVKHPDRHPYELAREHLASTVAHPASLLHVAEQLRRARDPRARIFLADACAVREDETTGAALDAAIGDRDDRVALMAARGVKVRRRVSAVEPLIERFAALTKRGGESVLLREVEAALLRITGEQFASAAEWVSFWAARRVGFVPPADVRRELGSTRERPRFFGAELRSDRVVFVVDVSGSMRHGSPSRLERTQQQLVKLINDLPERADFAVIAFSGPDFEGNGLPKGLPPQGPLPEVVHGTRWLWHTGPKLLRATVARRQAAIEFVGALHPTGMTFTLEALRRAFELEGADLIVLLSDGQPEEVDRERWRWRSEREIVEEVARLNRYLCRRIDTFGLGGEGDRFLEELAARTGGTFTSLE